MLWLIKINCVICHEAILIEENNSSYPNLVAGGKALPIFKDFTHSAHIWTLKVKQGPLDLIVCSLSLLVVMEPLQQFKLPGTKNGGPSLVTCIGV